eukprot:g71417.t1
MTGEARKFEEKNLSSLEHGLKQLLRDHIYVMPDTHAFSFVIGESMLTSWIACVTLHFDDVGDTTSKLTTDWHCLAWPAYVTMTIFECSDITVT